MEQQPQPPTLGATATPDVVVEENKSGTEKTRRRRRPRGVLALIDDSKPLTLYPYSSDYWKSNNNNSAEAATSPTTTRHGPQSKKQRRRQMRRLQEQQQNDNDDEESGAIKDSTHRPTTRLMPLETILQGEHDDDDACQVVVLFLFDPQQAYSKKLRDGLVRVISSSGGTTTSNGSCIASSSTTSTAAPCTEAGQKIVCLAMPAPGTVVFVLPTQHDVASSSRPPPTTTINEDSPLALVEEGGTRMSSSSSLSLSWSPMVDEFLKDSGFFLSTYTSDLALVLQSSLNKVPSFAVIPTSLGRNVAATHEELALEWNNNNNNNNDTAAVVLDTCPAAAAAAGSNSSGVGCNVVAQAWLSGKSALGTVQQITAHILFPSCTIQ